MKVKDVLCLARELLNLPIEVQRCLGGETGEDWVQQEVDTLLQCFNVVEKDLAVDYLPLYNEDTVQTATGSIFYTSLTRKPVRILGVKDGNGSTLKYTLFPEYIKTESVKYACVIRICRKRNCCLQTAIISCKRPKICWHMG